jgi:hypothetical protein
MTEWPEVLVQAVRVQLGRRGAHADSKTLREALEEALGGERVWRHKETGAVVFGLRQHPPHFEPALLVPLEG